MLAKIYPRRSIKVGERIARWEFSADFGGSCKLESRINATDYPSFRQVIPPEREFIELQTSLLRKANGKHCAIGPAFFNPRYVDEALRGAPKRVRVQVSRDEHEPMLIRYDNRLAVVMPIRVPQQPESTP